MEAAGEENTQEIGKVREWQARMRDFKKQTGLLRQGEREGGRVLKSDGSKKTVGFSFLSGDTRFTNTSQARSLGESVEGWDKHERIFKDNYLERFKLKDDVERTIGFWGGPEPSFNAHVRGRRENVIEMAKAWGKDYHQQGMALLIPNPKGAGGKLIWNFGKELSDSEMDMFFKNLDDLNKELGEEFNDYFGVTTRGSKSIEYWYKDKLQRNNAYYVIRKAIKQTKLPAKYDKKTGFDFMLLLKGQDY